MNRLMMKEDDDHDYLRVYTTMTMTRIMLMNFHIYMQWGTLSNLPLLLRFPFDFFNF
jgi:hypothetical protein